MNPNLIGNPGLRGHLEDKEGYGGSGKGKDGGYRWDKDSGYGKDGFNKGRDGFGKGGTDKGKDGFGKGGKEKGKGKWENRGERYQGNQGENPKIAIWNQQRASAELRFEWLWRRSPTPDREADEREERERTQPKTFSKAAGPPPPTQSASSSGPPSPKKNKKLRQVFDIYAIDSDDEDGQKKDAGADICPPAAASGQEHNWAGKGDESGRKNDAKQDGDGKDDDKLSLKRHRDDDKGGKKKNEKKKDDKKKDDSDSDGPPKKKDKKSSKKEEKKLLKKIEEEEAEANKFVHAWMVKAIVHDEDAMQARRPTIDGGIAGAAKKVGGIGGGVKGDEEEEDSDDDFISGPIMPDYSKDPNNPSNLRGEKQYGGALMPGEGALMAQFVQNKQRIPRRGEVGVSAEEIDALEAQGYVMSGSRHKKMNAIRIRKENQVYTAEEQAALAMYKYEQRLEKEKERTNDLKELLAARQEEIQQEKDSIQQQREAAAGGD